MPVVDDDRHVLGVLSETDILAKEAASIERRRHVLSWLVGSGPTRGARARSDAVTVERRHVGAAR